MKAKTTTYMHWRALADAAMQAWVPYVHAEGISRRALEDEFRAWWKKETGHRWQGRDVAFNEKLVAYVRHTLTDYEQQQERMWGNFGKAGGDVFFAKGNDKVNPLILEAFPWLEPSRCGKLRRSW